MREKIKQAGQMKRKKQSELTAKDTGNCITWKEIKFSN